MKRVMIIISILLLLVTACARQDKTLPPEQDIIENGQDMDQDIIDEEIEDGIGEEEGNVIEDEREEVNDPEENEVDDLDFNMATGIYIGAIDSNSVEINVQEIPEGSTGIRVFAISEGIVSEIALRDLNTNDRIKFQYYFNEDFHRDLIVEIVKID
ncbi:hypothetical protein EDC18_10853 [Natranaerovirga pectinivora]|uniref:Protease stability complex PrcB-like protein n=1 Tax=Natranaerovirga pectinivora TaxID=682400 RepID=A0A4R3MJZ3_9FIRM|nr:hypothetical protein [Natranaerovirga pectinivora]TCT13817.1 hypothetical protein EDC18_10853 [Natranaerovirga pectinivora]